MPMFLAMIWAPELLWAFGALMVMTWIFGRKFVEVYFIGLVLGAVLSLPLTAVLNLTLVHASMDDGGGLWTLFKWCFFSRWALCTFWMSKEYKP